MRRFISATLLVVFFSWIVPLGIFIAPSKEKLLCDGQRAICLCSHGGGALSKKSQSGETVMKVNPSTQKEASGSFLSSQFELAAQLFDKNSGKTTLYFLRHQNLYQLLVCTSIDHVPKA